MSSGRRFADTSVNYWLMLIWIRLCPSWEMIVQMFLVLRIVSRTSVSLMSDLTGDAGLVLVNTCRPWTCWQDPSHPSRATLSHTCVTLWSAESYLVRRSGWTELSWDFNEEAQCRPLTEWLTEDLCGLDFTCRRWRNVWWRDKKGQGLKKKTQESSTASLKTDSWCFPLSFCFYNKLNKREIILSEEIFIKINRLTTK